MSFWVVMDFLTRIKGWGGGLVYGCINPEMYQHQVLWQESWKIKLIAWIMISLRPGPLAKAILEPEWSIQTLQDG